MGQSARLKTSCATLQPKPARVNRGHRGQLGKPLIQKNLIISHDHGTKLHARTSSQKPWEWPGQK